MKESKVSERLRYIMDTRNIRQVDILEAAKPFCKKFQKDCWNDTCIIPKSRKT